MCWRDDIVETRHCSVCGQVYYGSLSHLGCPGFEKNQVPAETSKPPEETALRLERLERDRFPF